MILNYIRLAMIQIHLKLVYKLAIFYRLSEKKLKYNNDRKK